MINRHINNLMVLNKSDNIDKEKLSNYKNKVVEVTNSMEDLIRQMNATAQPYESDERIWKNTASLIMNKLNDIKMVDHVRKGK
jgi:hypothetical protein